MFYFVLSRTKMAAGSIVYVGIAPHPPIMVPEVGGQAITEVRGSIDAMRDLTERVIMSGAETIVLISPHAPLDARASARQPLCGERTGRACADNQHVESVITRHH